MLHLFLLINVPQGWPFRKHSAFKFLASFVGVLRQDVPVVNDDRVLYNDIKNAENFINNLTIEVDELY